MTETPIPRWQKALAGLYAAGIVVVLVVFHARLSADFWPPDSSRVAPNLLASAIIVTVVTVIGVLVWPPTRRRLHRFVDKKLDPVHARISELHARHDQHDQNHAELVEHLARLEKKITARDET